MKRILVIEDNELLRDNIAEILELEGYEVYKAQNGQIGVEKALDMLPDLIISDVNMPIMDGFGVLENLRQHEETKTTPFIFLTVKNTLQDIREGMNLGADDYLTKPFDMAELLGAVEKRLEIRREIVAKETEKYDRLKNSVGLPIATVIDDPLRNIERLADLVNGELDHLDKKEIAEIATLICTTAQKLRKEVVKILYFYRIQALRNNENDLSELKKLRTADISGRIKSVSEEVAQGFRRHSDLYLSLEEGTLAFPEEFLEFSIKELVENAFKYSARNCPVKVIGSKKGDNYEIIVQDKGIGLKANHIQELIPFDKSDLDLKQGDGLGLGLYDVKQLIELFDGQISMASEEGMGTSFTLTFPAG